MVCQLNFLKHIGTSDPNPGVAACQPGNVSLVRNLQHVLFLAVNTNKFDKLQALPGVLPAAAKPALHTCLPVREGLRQTLQLPR